MPGDDHGEGRAAFVRLMAALERIQDGVVAAEASPVVFSECASMLEATAERIESLPVVPQHQDELASRVYRGDLGVRDRGMTPPFEITYEDENSIEVRVTFPLRFVGLLTVHGGHVATLFDEVMGHLVSRARAAVSRTASLEINYRYLTPTLENLECRARTIERTGRKQWVEASLTSKGVVIADARGLWVDAQPEGSYGREPAGT